MCALQDNTARYLRARARPVLVSCEESQRVEISLSRYHSLSPCDVHVHLPSGTISALALL